MNSIALQKIQDLAIDIHAVTALIAETQMENGEIPWSTGDKTDPWDHVEAAIGLCIGGEYQKAHMAYRWLAETQLADGSWYSSYRNGQPDDKTNPPGSVADTGAILIKVLRAGQTASGGAITGGLPAGSDHGAVEKQQAPQFDNAKDEQEK